MAYFSKLGIILCSVLGVILLGLVAELYHFFCWKKKSNKNTEQKKHSNWLLSFLFWRKNPISAVNNHSTEEVSSTVEAHGRHHEQEKQDEDLEAGIGNGRQTLLKELVEESVESELIRLHNLCGPPRFLFTIKEETKEELMDQSEDVVVVNGSIKGSKSRRSLNDLITDVDDATSNPIEKMAPLESFNHNGFNHLFESLTDNKQQYSSIILSKDSDSDLESLREREFNRLRSSPPPKLKFLRDAEEKLIKRLVEEAEKRGCFQDSVEEKDGSFIAFLNLNKEREKGIINEQQHVPIQNSGPRKVLPLATSPPSIFTPLVKNRS